MRIIKTLFFIVFLLAYSFGIFLKTQIIKEKQDKEIPTISSIWERDGQPVYVHKVKKEAFFEYEKISFRVLQNNLIEAYCPNRYKSEIRTGEKGNFIVNEILYEDVEIKRIEKTYNYSGYFKAIGKIKNNNNLHKGLLYVARARNRKSYEGLLIPNEAIINTNNKSFVFIVQKSKLKKNEITVVKSNYKDSLVTGNIKENDYVVTSDTRDLKVDNFVKPISSEI